MQAIVTKFIPPTNKIGPRYQARCQARTIYVSQRDADGPVENHRNAARALVYGMGWSDYGTWIAGGLPDGSTVWVCNEPRSLLQFNLKQQPDDTVYAVTKDGYKPL